MWREGWVWVGKGLLRGVRSHSCAHLREGGRKERESLGRSVGGGRKSALGRGSTKGGNVNRREPDGCSPGRGKEPCAALLHCTAALPTDTSRCSCRGSSPTYESYVCVRARAIQQTYTDTIRCCRRRRRQKHTQNFNFLYIHTYTHTCMYVRMYVCMHMYVCICICRRTHKHTHVTLWWRRSL